MVLTVCITGHNLESSKYYFKVESNIIYTRITTESMGSFSISTKLIRIPSLLNTAMNLNGASLGRRTKLIISNDAIEELLNSSAEIQPIGLNLLRQEIINHYRI